MIDFDPFERRFSAALVQDADAALASFDARLVARLAMEQSGPAARPIPAQLRPLGRIRSGWVAGAAIVVLTAVVIGLRSPANPVNGGPSSRPSVTPSAPPQSPARQARGRWTPGPAMSTAHGGGLVAVQLADGRVLVTGGGDGATAAEIYDPLVNTWTPTNGMRTGRSLAAGTLLRDGRVLVVGGYPTIVGLPGPIGAPELFDPATGTWSATAPLVGTPAGGSATLLLDGRVLFAKESGATELFDASSGTWVAGPTMHRGASGPATRLLDGRVLVAGGGPIRSTAAEIYDPSTNEWVEAESLPEGYHGATGTLLGDGRVLLAGGDAPTGSGARGYPHAVLFDPATKSWQAAPDMLRGRLAHAAVLLGDGRVLVAGGAAVGAPTTPSDVFGDAEMFDPMSNTWGWAASMPTPGAGAAVLLASGKVLVIQGWTTDHEPSTSTALFDPLASE